MSDAAFDKGFQIVLKNEGGYVNNPKDPGGETNMGICKRQYPDLDIKNLTVEKVKAIYYSDYWLRFRINQLPDGISPKVLDTSVLAGGVWAIKILQKSLGAAADGICGHDTQAAAQLADTGKLLTIYCRLLEQHYDAIAEEHPNLEQFQRGWDVRALQRDDN